MPEIGLVHYLTVGAVLFGLGMFTVMTRKNAVGILLGVELILNAAALNFVAFEHFIAGGVAGQVFTVFIIILAASEAAIGLAIVLQVFRGYRSIQADRLTDLRN
jgi:NADH-quinone oxidoreductase subunit K